ncbi:aquaporin [Candidatus Saccharibacteria bacterium]|nr:aquaporin [Candidatus Saccharibacteria bacterium]
MATTKSKKTVKKSSKPASKTVKTTAKVEKVVEAPVATQASGNPFKGFFARKYDANETISTIFKNPKIYGAIIGEVVGTMLLTLILLTLGVYQPLYVMFGVIAISAAVLAFSGANLNPLVTVGMMVTRRMSVIRGVVYMLSQVLGAWFAYLISSAFINAAEGGALAELPKITAAAPEQFWVVTMIEFVAAIVIAFFFARAYAYKRSTLTFAVIYGTGICVALLFAIVVSTSFLGMQNNFIVNPAAAFMYQVLPTGGENFGAVFGDVCLALATYVVFPMIGGIIGFAISDVASKLSGIPACTCGAGCACKDITKK